MKCRQCGNTDTKVLESRESKDSLTIRRRRSCPSCGYRFTTFEKMEDLPLFVVKRDGSREPFIREKLFQSMLVACRKRAVPTAKLESIVDWVEQNVATSDDRELSTACIGELVLNSLRKLDAVAYVRFASVYRAFTNTRDFVLILEELDKKSQDLISPDLAQRPCAESLL